MSVAAKTRDESMTTPYLIKPEDAASISDLDVAFGTTRFLPPPEQIPADFKGQGTPVTEPYLDLVSNLFYGRPLSDMNCEFINGHDQTATVRCVRAHLKSWTPKHQHKIAGVAYMLSQMLRLEAPDAT